VAKIETREYKDRKDFEKDANRRAKDGWAVVSTTEHRQKMGLFRLVALGPIFGRRKPKLLVTYRRD